MARRKSTAAADPPPVKLAWVPTARCRLLERNPQTVSPAEQAALVRSIRDNGMLAPILVRPRGTRYEIISGNHRFLACQELGLPKVPAVVADLTDDRARVLAVNLNLIHGEPTPEQLAPFLGDMGDKLLAEVHLTGDLLRRTLAFDTLLADRLKTLSDVPGLDAPTPRVETRTCTCPTCGKTHFRPKS